MEQDEIELYGLWEDCPLQSLFTALHMALEETRGVLRNAAVCMIACLVSDLPAAIAQLADHATVARKRKAQAGSNCEKETGRVRCHHC
jgi:hypothetical protein